MTGTESGAVTPCSGEEVVTYVVVVHGIGEQRKNETAVAVVNRFAEARREPREDDQRDVLTLGAASRQTGTSTDTGGLGGDELPWMEFEGIPSVASQATLQPFMGQTSSTGKNLRFVDMCWSDVLRTAYVEAGQPVEVWAKGLLGRLLRKHESAEDGSPAQVPFWIRRTLYLLADGLLLTRKAMRFRFKEMEDLVFAKFLGDVQIYGEYARCRGRAVHRFHNMMASIEAEHCAREKSNGTCRKARYVVIAHSLGSVMSFDALMYASAKETVRKGECGCWEFPGYRESSNGNCNEAPPTDWIRHVESFVTLGSPIDKYLMIWWMNYRYLCSDGYLKETEEACRIRHFNYCDELDPVGHHLELVGGTNGYKAVFKKCEDIVFNRYGVPGVAHNEYWADQGLWRWIIDKSVDKGKGCADVPEWFLKRKYLQLLRWLYVWVPVAVVGIGGAALTLALEVSSWQTAVVCAAAFAVVLYLGRRVIDLAVWWRQVQRQEGKAALERNLSDVNRDERNRAARGFRWRAKWLPVAMALVGAAGVWLKTSESCGTCIYEVVDPALRGALVAGVVLVVLVFISRGRLPSAYRTPASGEGGVGAEWVAGLFGAVSVGLGIVAGIAWPWPAATSFPDAFGNGIMNLTVLIVLASVVWAYRWRRWRIAQIKVVGEGGGDRKVCYDKYAEDFDGLGCG